MKVKEKKKQEIRKQQIGINDVNSPSERELDKSLKKYMRMSD
jgi:hypothetical protein